MLEESRMDKKNRSSPQSRASAVDCKKNSELTHKPCPRNNKKREGSGSTSKNELHRKNVPAQRGRGQNDRRPRTRGSSNFALGGTTNARIEKEEEPEIGSVFVPGSKKQNLNHLLNFTLPSRGVPEHRGPQWRRIEQQYRVPFRNECDLYLKAYCQFLVKEDGDYKDNLLSPDVPIKWEQIEEIVVRGTGRPECPICLGSPAAGRVGLCGHVYCWACILHYAAAHEKQPPPCPLCASSLRVADMKPTRIVQWDSPAEEVTMRLVRRLRGSTTVEVAPMRGILTEAAKPILPLENLSNSPYSKMFYVTKQQVHDIIYRERDEINKQILAEIDTTELVFLEQALELLKLKEEHIKLDEPKLVEEKALEVPTVYEVQEVNENKLDWFDVNEEGAASVEILHKQMEELNVGVENMVDSNLNPEASSFDIDGMTMEGFPVTDSPPSLPEETNDITDVDKLNKMKYFYFYQSDDGQQIFLNSINIRVLNASWGTLAAAPQTITGRVLQRETFSLSEQTRKRMPCTAHLPLQCVYDIVELDLQPPYVSNTALQSFTDELERRARIRARHDREERRRERAYHRDMEGRIMPDFLSEVMFPPTTPSYSSPPSEPAPINTFEESSPSTSGSTSLGPSFATMASSCGAWRVRNKVAEPPPPVVNEDISAPRNLVLSDAIEAALQAASSASGKKKKKSKKQVLFTTGMQRTN